MAGSPMKFAEMPTSEECGGVGGEIPFSRRLYVRIGCRYKGWVQDHHFQKKLPEVVQRNFWGRARG